MQKQTNTAKPDNLVRLERFQLADLRMGAQQIERLAIAAKLLCRQALAEETEHMSLRVVSAVVESLLGDVDNILDLLNDLSPESEHL